MIQGAARHKCQHVSSTLKKQSMNEDTLLPSHAVHSAAGCRLGKEEPAGPGLTWNGSRWAVESQWSSLQRQPPDGPFLWLLLLPRPGGRPHTTLDGGGCGGCCVHLRVFCRRLLPSPADLLSQHYCFLTLNSGREGFSCRN